MRILDHNEVIPDTRVMISLSGWVGVSCKPGEIDLIIKVTTPIYNSLLGDHKWYSEIHKYTGSRLSLRKAVQAFLENAPKSNDVVIQQAMLYLYPMFK
jgi:hypothetical protein